MIDFAIANRRMPNIRHESDGNGGMVLSCGNRSAVLQPLKNGKGYRYRIVGITVWMYFRGGFRGALRRTRRAVAGHDRQLAYIYTRSAAA